MPSSKCAQIAALILRESMNSLASLFLRLQVNSVSSGQLVRKFSPSAFYHCTGSQGPSHLPSSSLQDGSANTEAGDDSEGPSLLPTPTVQNKEVFSAKREVFRLGKRFRPVYRPLKNPDSAPPGWGPLGLEDLSTEEIQAKARNDLDSFNLRDREVYARMQKGRGEERERKGKEQTMKGSEWKRVFSTDLTHILEQRRKPISAYHWYIVYLSTQGMKWKTMSIFKFAASTFPNLSEKERLYLTTLWEEDRAQQAVKLGSEMDRALKAASLRRRSLRKEYNFPKRPSYTIRRLRRELSLASSDEQRQSLQAAIEESRGKYERAVKDCIQRMRMGSTLEYEDLREMMGWRPTSWKKKFRFKYMNVGPHNRKLK